MELTSHKSVTSLRNLWQSIEYDRLKDCLIHIYILDHITTCCGTQVTVN